MAGGHGGGHAPKASSNHGGGGFKIGEGPAILGICVLIASCVVAILGG